MMMRSRLACGLHCRDAIFDGVVEVLVGEGEVQFAGLDPAEIEQVVDDGGHAFAGSADVLHVLDVTLIAERAEPFIDHHFGEADDGIERRADLVADPRQHVGLGACRAICQPPRLAQLALALSDLRQVAKHGEEMRKPLAGCVPWSSTAGSGRPRLTRPSTSRP